MTNIQLINTNPNKAYRILINESNITAFEALQAKHEATMEKPLTTKDMREATKRALLDMNKL